MGRFWQHFKTITHHRHLVLRGCFRVGLFRQGLLHDLSKYSPAEFFVGVKYYQGTRSPNAAEREDKGYSEAWMHHKGRNRHHFEYWTDLNLETKVYSPVPMPRRYVAEMVMDRIAACKTYQGKNYDPGAPLAYFVHAKESRFIHPETADTLVFLLTMLKETGEDETFRYIRTQYLKDAPLESISRK